MNRFFITKLQLCIFLFVSFSLSAEINISHGIAMHGETKYKSNFKHLDYVNPEAIKGGKVVFSTTGTFDSLNPFILKGNPAAGVSNLFETLTLASSDEAFSQYGLIAETIEWPDDRSWVAFTLRDEARWHDGKKITADDVIWTFNTLMEKGHPFYNFYYGDVVDVIKENNLKVKFIFKGNTNKELVLIVGQLPVLPKHYWENKDFEETTLEIPIGSGPYKIKSFDAGKSITYEINLDYWGKNVPIKKGTDNFGIIKYDYYKDRNIEREAFKSGEMDFFSENSSKEWATSYEIPAVENKLIIKELIEHENPQGMQAFAFNIRKDFFKDKKVREALSYAFDFEWSNKNLFYNAYKRTNSYFENSELASDGLPSELELKFLNKYKQDLPKDLFIKEFNPPKTDGSGFIRSELKEATKLLKEAGWDLVNGKLIEKESKKHFEFEILLNSPAFERIVLPFKQNLEKLGITANVRTIDSAQYQKLLENFEFDMVVATFRQSLSPGNEQRDFWGSQAADTIGSRNIIGIQDPIVDKLIEKLINAKDRKELITLTKSLDRVLLWNHYIIPQWHISSYRTLHWDIFDKPEVRPKYSLGTNTWWIDENKQGNLKERKKSIQ
ncbi:MAG: Oligopeptide-binding protein AppA [Alphaproteobacteria bacterium MarineAlpha5_Bin9]|nr:MAG: Oligopeptide-binding protein AppA [Alphaproteobacteria bacterium MarineAlpha5_Bin9]|tara:strand:- start:5368 stop:7200 length:1833 start_codon:yes stop_codon:yes gene_type:complete